ncbi:MAG: arginine decarboxylase, pyruvoyl-dependent [Calditrichaeota bacterium]|nr:MAG: arginine decarboxylase, pyruvoyl-dependent [Calditrichota bacterium]
MYVPKKIFFTRGLGIHKEKLTSFELALRNAGIAPFNLVGVSSIYPAGCVIVDRDEGLRELIPGQIVHAVYSKIETNEPHRLIASSIGMARPRDENAYGYLSEHHGYGETEEQSGNYAQDLAAEMLATILGVEFDPDSSWDEKRQIWTISNKIVETRNITQAARGDAAGRWTTVVTAAILLP